MAHLIMFRSKLYETNTLQQARVILFFHSGVDVEDVPAYNHLPKSFAAKMNPSVREGNLNIFPGRFIMERKWHDLTDEKRKKKLPVQISEKLLGRMIKPRNVTVVLWKLNINNVFFFKNSMCIYMYIYN